MRSPRLPLSQAMVAPLCSTTLVFAKQGFILPFAAFCAALSGAKVLPDIHTNP